MLNVQYDRMNEQVMDSIAIFKITRQSLGVDEIRAGVVAVAPVQGGDLPAAEYYRFMVPYVVEHGHLIAPGEMGCVLSHLSIYRRVVENGRGAVILEEDINASLDLLNQARTLCGKSGLDFIHLGWHPNVLSKRGFRGRRQGPDGVWEIDPRVGFVGAFAYYVSPRAAKELIAFHSPYPKKADAWADFIRSSSIVPYFRGIFFHPVERGGLSEERKSAKAYRLRRIVVAGLRRWVREKLNRFFVRAAFRKILLPGGGGLKG